MMFTVFLQEGRVKFCKKVSVRKTVTKHVQAGFYLFFGKVLQYPFHYNDRHVSFRQVSGPVIIKGTAGKHGTAVPVFIHFATDLDLVRKIHIEPDQFPVIDLRKLIIKATSQVDAEGIRILFQQFFEFLSEHDRSRNNSLMG